jgi:hypothetical protein
VSVRLGDTHYSAGRQAIRSLPAWTELRERDFSVRFLVESASLAAAQEDSFDVIRSAWEACGIDARPGDDFDGSGLQVRSASGG